MCPPPGGPSRWNPYCYSPGPLGTNDVADPNCRDVADAGNPTYYAGWEGKYDKRGNLIGVRRHCLQADREYSLHFRRAGDILDLAGGGNPGIWINAESEDPKGRQTTIATDPKRAAKALEYVRKTLGENLPVSVGVNVSGQNSGRINGAIVDHWLAIDGYRVNGQDAITELYATDNAAGVGASWKEYRIRFEVRPDGSIVKPAVAGLRPDQAHADIELEYQSAVLQVYVKDIEKGEHGTLTVHGITLDAWREGKKAPFRVADWAKIPGAKVPQRLR